MSIFPQSGAGSLRLNTSSCRYCSQPVVPGTDLCEYHGSEAFRLVTQPQRAGYRDPAYRRARRVAIRRAKGKCEECGRPLPRRSDGRLVFQTHHRDRNPRNNDPSNIEVCGPCCHSGSRSPS